MIRGTNLLPFVVLLLWSSTMLAQSSWLAGTWDAAMTSGAPHTAHFMFDVKRDTFTGTLKGLESDEPNKVLPITEGRIQGKDISFTVVSDKYTGTFQDGQIKMVLRAHNGPFVFARESEPVAGSPLTGKWGIAKDPLPHRYYLVFGPVKDGSFSGTAVRRNGQEYPIQKGKFADSEATFVTPSSVKDNDPAKWQAKIEGSQLTVYTDTAMRLVATKTSAAPTIK